MTKTRLLLVDDDMPSLVRTSGMLQLMGYSLTPVNGRSAALEVAREAPFDLAVLDLHAPDGRCHELCQALLRRHRLRSVISIGSDRHEDVLKAIDAGAMSCVAQQGGSQSWMLAIEAALARASELARLQATQAKLEEALTRARLISLAVGMVMAQQGLREREAFNRLRAASRNARRPMLDHCREMVDAAAAAAAADGR